LEIPIQVNNFNNGKVLTINVEINKEKATFLLDTGASTSIIDLRKLDKFTSVKPLKSLNISSLNNNIDAYKIKIDEFILGDKKLNNHTFQVVDLINLNNTFSTNYINVIDGILGNDIIFEIISNINIDKNTIETYLY